MAYLPQIPICHAVVLVVLIFLYMLFMFYWLYINYYIGEEYYTKLPPHPLFDHSLIQTPLEHLTIFVRLYRDAIGRVYMVYSAVIVLLLGYILQ